MEILTPYDIPHAIPKTSTDDLEQDDLYQLALEVAQDVQALYTYCTERPRFASLWDQAARSSSSVLNNYCEAHGKLLGHFRSALLISRGEGYELYGSLSILPKEQAGPIKDKLKKLLAMLDQRILAIPEKPRWTG